MFTGKGVGGRRGGRGSGEAGRDREMGGRERHASLMRVMAIREKRERHQLF